MVTASKKPEKRRGWLVFVIAFLCFGLIGMVIGYGLRPFVRNQLVGVVEDRFEGKVELADVHISVWPAIRVTGEGLVLRLQGKTNIPPLITLTKFSFQTGLWELLRPVKHVQSLWLEGLHIQIPPRQNGEHHVDQNNGDKTSRPRRLVRFVVDKLSAEDAELDLLPKNSNKPVRVFQIHQLTMGSIGLGRPATFHVTLTNPKPIGQIDVRGHFGPWQGDDPSETPLSGNFTFSQADLKSIKGLAGTLSSSGKFTGVLNRIDVEGDSDTPDFSLDISDNPVHLRTQYKAVVDGTNGNTLLNPVHAEFLHSQILAEGGVFRSGDLPGRTVRLNLTVTNGGLQDLLRLAVKGARPPMTGHLGLQAKFDLPPGEGSISDRLNLDGDFKIDKATFTTLDLAEKVKALSRVGQGMPGQKTEGSDIFDLSSRFSLRNGTMSLSNLAFSVPGAAFHFNGSYALRTEDINFHGTLSLEAKLSQMTTGIKSILLKAVDPFFRKNGLTVLPIKVTGTRADPLFGPDFGHKSK